jgi:cytochrome c oxidase cbb3-type subunit 2
MRNGLFFFLGLFGALALSWVGLVLWPNYQLGHLKPFVDENEGKAFPERISGLAAQGARVYEDLGCAACHTQQVRRPDFGSDKARGWGDRQSVARDYVHQTRVQLGDSRLGPDLANVGARKPAHDAGDFFRLLYAGTPNHPAFNFLFTRRSTEGRQSSDQALDLPGTLAAPAGYEIVPSYRARALVAYLLSLNNAYEYPEARPIEPAAKEGEAK